MLKFFLSLYIYYFLLSNLLSIVQVCFECVSALLDLNWRMVLSRSTKEDSVTADCWSCCPQRCLSTALIHPKSSVGNSVTIKLNSLQKLFNNDKVYMSMSNDIDNTELGTVRFHCEGMKQGVFSSLVSGLAFPSGRSHRYGCLQFQSNSISLPTPLIHTYTVYLI